MKLLKIVQLGRIEMYPIKGRIVGLVSKVIRRYITDEGVHELALMPDFRWDGRSGPCVVDIVAPNQGTQNEAGMWLGHDAGGYPNTVSGSLGNELLKQGLALDCKYAPTTCHAVHAAVSLTVDSWKADDWSEVDKEWLCNKGKIIYHWEAK